MQLAEMFNLTEKGFLAFSWIKIQSNIGTLKTLYWTNMWDFLDRLSLQN
jgi:hypothetical protein